MLVVLAGCAHEEARPPVSGLAAAEQQKAIAEQNEALRADCETARAGASFDRAMFCASVSHVAFGDDLAAVAWWRLAAAAAQTRAQACQPIALIAKTSVRPSQDLAAVDPGLLAACAGEAQEQREAQASQRQQEALIRLREQNCEAQCGNSHAACMVGAADGFGQAGCNLQRGACLHDCRGR